jgi:hypothetical protein
LEQVVIVAALQKQTHPGVQLFIKSVGASPSDSATNTQWIQVSTNRSSLLQTGKLPWTISSCHCVNSVSNEAQDPQFLEFIDDFIQLLGATHFR